MGKLDVQGAAPESVGAAQGLGPWPAQGEHTGVQRAAPEGKQGVQGVGPRWGGGGGHNHPIPASGRLGGHKPPLREDHNFPLPETGDPCGGRFRPKVGYNHPLPPSPGGVRGSGAGPWPTASPKCADARAACG